MILVIYHEKRDPTPKPFPPGTRVPLLRDGETHSATVEHTPLIPSDSPNPPDDPPYLLQFDDITAIGRKYEELREVMHPSTTASSKAPHYDIGLPSLFHYGSKYTMEINGVFHKGYIKHQADKTYRFSVRHGPFPPTELWGIPLHEFEQNWEELMMEETLFPVHNLVYSLLHPSSSPHQPRASFVSS